MWIGHFPCPRSAAIITIITRHLRKVSTTLKRTLLGLAVPPRVLVLVECPWEAILDSALVPIHGVRLRGRSEVGAGTILSQSPRTLTGVTRSRNHSHPHPLFRSRRPRSRHL